MERVLIVVEMVPRLRIVGVARLRRASYVAGIVRRRGLRLAFQVPALFLEVPDDSRNRPRYGHPAAVHHRRVLQIRRRGRTPRPLPAARVRRPRLDYESHATALEATSSTDPPASDRPADEVIAAAEPAFTPPDRRPPGIW